MQGLGKRIASLGIAVAALALGACGSDDSGPGTFEHDGFPFTFEYPSGFEISDDVEFSQELGSEADESAAVVLDEENGLILTRYTLAAEVDEANLSKVKPEFDGLIQQVDPDAEAEEGQVDDFPALTYENVTFEDTQGRFVILFDGATQFQLNCQATEDHRDEIEAACDRALATLTRS